MKYSSIPAAQSVVDHCKARGISNIIISPGSRNAPLTIGFSEDPFFNCYSIVDERCAAFFALGMAQQLRKPTAVLCTSGSALLNYYPAVSEAFYSDLPLVVISADRPSYKVDIGDGQTIRQENVFEKHIGYSANLKQDVVHATERIVQFDPDQLAGRSLEEAQVQVQQYNDTELDKALNMACTDSSPVHINIPFEEPLYQTEDKPRVVPQIHFIEGKGKSELASLGKYRGIWKQAKRKMVLVGVLPPNTIEKEFLDILAEDPSVVVFTECTSNLSNTNFFPNIDSILAPIEKSGNREELFGLLQPEVVLTFGGLVVSKKIKAFLRAYPPATHWHVDIKKANDTFFCLGKHFKTGPNDFLRGFLDKTTVVESGYKTFWAAKREHYRMQRERYLGKIPFTDLWAFNFILESIPKNFQLQLGNSSTVRYAQLFDIDPSIGVFCNRGTSGIDGSTSTAIGASVYNETSTLLVTGDLSFLYDSNGLWNNYIRADFRIIVINNDGGGIFRILPGKEETQNFNTFFETTHNLNLRSLAELYGFGYESVAEKEDLKEALYHFYKSSERPKILEVKTPRLLNDKILLSYFDFIS